VTVLSVPFHLDEPLPAFVPPVPPDEVIAPDLPPGSPWERMAVLYAEVADALGRDELQVVLSGDCTTALAVVAGLLRKLTYPALLAVTGLTLVGVWRSVLDPWGWVLEGTNALFFPSVIVFAGALVVYAFRGADVLAIDERLAHATGARAAIGPTAA